MHTKESTSLHRIAATVAEARLEHGLSQRQLEKWSGVSRATIAKVERGGRVDPALLIKLAGVFLALDVFTPPRFQDGVNALLRVVQDERAAA